MLFAVGLGLRDRAEGARLRSLLADSETRMLALEDTVSVLRGARQITQIPISMEGRQGGLLIFQDPALTAGVVIVHGLPPAPSGNVYQFWSITESGMVRSVEVNADTVTPGNFHTSNATGSRPGDGGGAHRRARSDQQILGAAGPAAGSRHLLEQAVGLEDQRVAVVSATDEAVGEPRGYRGLVATELHWDFRNGVGGDYHSVRAQLAEEPPLWMCCRGPLARCT